MISIPSYVSLLQKKFWDIASCHPIIISLLLFLLFNHFDRLVFGDLRLTESITVCRNEFFGFEPSSVSVYTHVTMRYEDIFNLFFYFSLTALTAGVGVVPTVCANVVGASALTTLVNSSSLSVMCANTNDLNHIKTYIDPVVKSTVLVTPASMEINHPAPLSF